MIFRDDDLGFDKYDEVDVDELLYFGGRGGGKGKIAL